MVNNFTTFSLLRSTCLRLYVLAACMIFSLTSQANNFYFSSIGNDSYSSAQAQNPATPWKSITKLNVVFSTLVAGDSVLFKRGDTFYGTIVVNKSGSNGRPIVIGAYGTGSKPVITVLTTLSGWTLVSGGVYEASSTAIRNNVNLVALNGVPQAVGRYPNVNTSNGGYLTYEVCTGTTSITDNQLTSSINWTGAEVVMRKRHFIMERCKITNHSGGTITYGMTSAIYPAGSSSPSPAIGTKGFGYFIQRDARTLDQFGEWYFNPSTKKMQMYFGSNNPSSYTVRASTRDTLINIGDDKYITIDNIALEGANLAGIYANKSGNLTIQSCDMNLMGGKGIFILNTSNILIDKVNTNNILCGAIDINSEDYTNCTVRNCNIQNTGMIAGMGSFWNDTDYKGVCVSVLSQALIEYNVIEHEGFMPIQFNGSNITIKNNFINHYNIVKDDGGGIYTYQAGTDANPGPLLTNRVIKENIILNGVGAGAGTTGQIDVDGIFLDGRTTNVDILDNTVANIGMNGIYSNNSINLNIKGNTSFNNGTALGLTRYTIGYFSNLNVSKNIFYPKYSTQDNFLYADYGIDEPVTKSIQAVIQQLGKIDSNYVATPNSTGFRYYYANKLGGSNTFPQPMSFEGWKSYTGHEKASKLPSDEQTIPAYNINSLTSSNKFSNGAFNSNISGITTWSSNNGATSTWDNSSKITGTGSLKVAPKSSTTTYSMVYGALGGVSSTKNYILRFTTLATTNNGVARVYLRKAASPQTILTPKQTFNFGTSKVVNEFLFTAPASESGASFVMEIQQSSGTVYIDDLQFYEADASPVDIDDQLRFEYNATKSPKTVALDGTFITPDGIEYSGSVTLAPYTSKILTRKSVTNAARSSNTAASIKAPRVLVADDNIQMKITSYPNPTTTAFGLMVQGGTNEKVGISLVSVDGRIVYQTVGTTNKNYTFGSTLRPGIYIVRVVQGTDVQTLKVVKN